MIATSSDSTPFDNMKVLDVNGIRVHVFSDGLVKIYAKNKETSDRVMEYIRSEDLLEGLFDNNIFKKRN